MIITQKLEGCISLAVGKSKNNPRYKTEFKNLIVDIGLNNAATNSISSLVTKCGVGSSSNTPTTGGTTLGQIIGSYASVGTSVYNHSSGVPVWYTYSRFTFTFQAGSVIGGLS